MKRRDPETFRARGRHDGTSLTPVPAATRAKMLANWSLSKMAFGVIRALRHAASAFVSETVTIP
jgi:hypothetical protein